MTSLFLAHSVDSYWSVGVSVMSSDRQLTKHFSSAKTWHKFNLKFILIDDLTKTVDTWLTLWGPTLARPHCWGTNRLLDKSKGVRIVCRPDNGRRGHCLSVSVSVTAPFDTCPQLAVLGNSIMPMYEQNASRIPIRPLYMGHIWAIVDDGTKTDCFISGCR